MDVDLDRGGAPLKLTAERSARICDAIRAGVRPETAAMYNGVSARSYYRWMSLGRAADADPVYARFVDEVELALAEWEARDVLLIGEAAKTDWHAAAWRLERRLPSIYGKRERHEIANADESPFRIAAAPSFDPDIHLPGRQVEGTAAGYDAPDWVAAFIEEAAIFPNGKHDDQIDAFTQAVNWAHDRAPIYVRTYRAPPIPLDNPGALGLGGDYHDLTLERALRSHHNW
jgi:hypothetical protein